MANVTLNVKWYASWYSVYAHATSNTGTIFYSLCKNGKVIPFSLAYKRINGEMWAVLNPSNKVPGTYQLCVKVTDQHFNTLKTYSVQVKLPTGSPPEPEENIATQKTQTGKSTVYTSITVTPESQAVKWPDNGKLPEASFTIKTDKGTPVPYIQLTIYLNGMKRAETPVQPLGRHVINLPFGTAGEYKLVFTGYDESKRRIGQATAYVQVLPPIKKANWKTTSTPNNSEPSYGWLLLIGLPLLLLGHK